MQRQLAASLGVLLALGMLARAQEARPESMDRLIAHWKDEDPAVRSKASEEVIARWKDWSEEDVGKLRAATHDADSEGSARAREALNQVLIRQKCGPKVEEVEQQVALLHKAEGKLHLGGIINPGGPMYTFTPPMRKLSDMGSDIQPLLIEALKDEEIQGELALVLGNIGDREAVLPLIDCLVQKEGRLPRGEEEHDAWVLLGLSHLTGKEIGFSTHIWSIAPDAAALWHKWHEENRDYLYTGPASHRGCYVDMEAKLLHTPSDAYRKEHAWVCYDEVAHWKAGAEYERTLNEYCLSILIGHLPDRSATLTLAHVEDPRALTALNAMCGEVGANEWNVHDVVWALSIRGDPSSIPFLEKLVGMRDSGAAEAIKEIRSGQQRGGQDRGKPRQASEQEVARLKGQLKDDSPEARLAAAQGLWELEIRDGLPTLIALIKARPLPSQGRRVETVRKACETLGQMGDPSAIEALKGLLSENLNGTLATGEGGSGYSGRPDVVALAKLGDESGIPLLVDSIHHGDPLGVCGTWPGRGGDFARIGQKKYVREILPLLDPQGMEAEPDARVYAAGEVLHVLHDGR